MSVDDADFPLSDKSINMEEIGHDIHKLAQDLWPLNRSLTGDGVRQSLSIIKKHLPSLQVYEIPSGTPSFDWIVPQEWNVNEAWIKTPKGDKICNFKKNNLHLVGYSQPIKKLVSKVELDKHLYSIPEMPTAIPYVTSYYEKNWGFCITEEERKTLGDGDYEVYIDSELKEGSLTYGELKISGDSSKEVLLSTYICHPSMANNEISGMAVTTFLAKYLSKISDRRYSYRIIFVPETIGSLTYLSKNLDEMKENVIAGFNVTCVGDDRTFSYLPSREGNTKSDLVALHVLKHLAPDFRSYTWLDRGSDERQYCAPGINLPIASLMRTKYGEYPEYHTSHDDLYRVVTPQGLAGGYRAIRLCLEVIERDGFPVCQIIGEPQLGRRGLYKNVSSHRGDGRSRLMLHFLSYADGLNSLLDIAEKCDCPIWQLYPLVETLIQNGLIKMKH